MDRWIPALSSRISDECWSGAARTVVDDSRRDATHFFGRRLHPDASQLEGCAREGDAGDGARGSQGGQCSARVDRGEAVVQKHPEWRVCELNRVCGGRGARWLCPFELEARLGSNGNTA